MKKLFLLLLSVVQVGCVGGTLSDTKDFEMFPLRGASQEEGAGLKKCLKTAHRMQELQKKKTGKFARRLKDLPIDRECDDYLMAQQGRPGGYEIRAEIRENEQTVRWSVNQDGVIEEHLDGDDDQYLEL